MYRNVWVTEKKYLFTLTLFLCQDCQMDLKYLVYGVIYFLLKGDLYLHEGGIYKIDFDLSLNDHKPSLWYYSLCHSERRFLILVRDDS